MDKQTQKILMIAGVGVAAYLVYRMMKKDTTAPPDGGRMGIPEDYPSEIPQEVFDPIDYAMNEFGVTKSVAQEIKHQADEIAGNPQGHWYKESLTRAIERGREIDQQLLHEAWWVINEPNRHREYTEKTWGLNAQQSQELADYYRKHITHRDDGSTVWMEETKGRAAERGRSIWKQLYHEAHWQLYAKEGAQYGSFSGLWVG